jgi:hypothetical protein
MDNVQNCNSYINIPSSQTHRFFLIPHFICNMYQYIQQMLWRHVQSHVEECSLVLFYLIGPESSCDLGSETYKLNLKNYIYNYNNFFKLFISNQNYIRFYKR